MAAVVAVVAIRLNQYDPNQARDRNGRFEDEGAPSKQRAKVSARRGTASEGGATAKAAADKAIAGMHQRASAKRGGSAAAATKPKAEVTRTYAKNGTRWHDITISHHDGTQSHVSVNGEQFRTRTEAKAEALRHAAHGHDENVAVAVRTAKPTYASEAAKLAGQREVSPAHHDHLAALAHGEGLHEVAATHERIAGAARDLMTARATSAVYKGQSKEAVARRAEAQQNAISAQRRLRQAQQELQAAQETAATAGAKAAKVDREEAARARDYRQVRAIADNENLTYAQREARIWRHREAALKARMATTEELRQERTNLDALRTMHMDRETAREPEKAAAWEARRQSQIREAEARIPALASREQAQSEHARRVDRVYEPIADQAHALELEAAARATAAAPAKSGTPKTTRAERTKTAGAATPVRASATAGLPKPPAFDRSRYERRLSAANTMANLPRRNDTKVALRAEVGEKMRAARDARDLLSVRMDSLQRAQMEAERSGDKRQAATLRQQREAVARLYQKHSDAIRDMDAFWNSVDTVKFAGVAEGVVVGMVALRREDRRERTILLTGGHPKGYQQARNHGKFAPGDGGEHVGEHEGGGGGGGGGTSAKTRAARAEADKAVAGMHQREAAYMAAHPGEMPPRVKQGLSEDGRAAGTTVRLSEHGDGNTQQRAAVVRMVAIRERTTDRRQAARVAWPFVDLRTVRLLDDGAALAAGDAGAAHASDTAGAHRSWIQLFPVGTFAHPRYGELKFDRTLLGELKSNFDAGARGIEIALDHDHKAADEDPDSRAYGWLERVEFGDRIGHSPGLWGLVRWTRLGLSDVRDQIYRYISPEFKPDYTDDMTGKHFKNVLTGITLTNRPFLKVMAPVALSERAARLLTERGKVRVRMGAVSTRPWSEVNKRMLPKSAFLDHTSDNRSAWRLPIYEGAGPKDSDGCYTKRGPLNLNGLRAAYAALHGGRTGTPMTGVPAAARATLERLHDKYFGGEADSDRHGHGKSNAMSEGGRGRSSMAKTRIRPGEDAIDLDELDDILLDPAEDDDATDDDETDGEQALLFASQTGKGARRSATQGRGKAQLKGTGADTGDDGDEQADQADDDDAEEYDDTGDMGDAGDEMYDDEADTHAAMTTPKGGHSHGKYGMHTHRGNADHSNAPLAADEDEDEDELDDDMSGDEYADMDTDAEAYDDGDGDADDNDNDAVNGGVNNRRETRQMGGKQGRKSARKMSERSERSERMRETDALMLAEVLEERRLLQERVRLLERVNYEAEVGKLLDGWGRGAFQFSEVRSKAKNGDPKAKGASVVKKTGNFALSKVARTGIRDWLLSEEAFGMAATQRERICKLFETIAAGVVDLSVRGIADATDEPAAVKLRERAAAQAAGQGHGGGVDGGIGSNGGARRRVHSDDVVSAKAEEMAAAEGVTLSELRERAGFDREAWLKLQDLNQRAAREIEYAGVR